MALTTSLPSDYLAQAWFAPLKGFEPLPDVDAREGVWPATFALPRPARDNVRKWLLANLAWQHQRAALERIGDIDDAAVRDEVRAARVRTHRRGEPAFADYVDADYETPRAR